MKLSCNKSDLLEGINSVQRAVAIKNSNPTIQGILLESDGTNLKFSATDLEIGIQRTLNITANEPGSILVPAKLFSEIVKKLPDTMINLESDGAKLKIDYFLSTIEISVMNPKEFPQMPDVDGKSITLSAAEIKEALRRTLYAVSTEQARPVFTGVLFKMTDGKLEAVGTDGYRLALYTQQVETNEEIMVIIPAKTAREIQRLLKDQDIIVNFGDSQIIFEFGETKIFSRLIDGRFPNYSQLIPRDILTKITANITELKSSIERANVLTSGESKPIKISGQTDLRIESEAQNEGRINETLEVEFEGEPINQTLNSKFLIDALNVLNSEKVTIEFSRLNSPLVMKEENYITLLLPIITRG